jgi:hypothetical protein
MANQTLAATGSGVPPDRAADAVSANAARVASMTMSMSAAETS